MGNALIYWVSVWAIGVAVTFVTLRFSIMLLDRIERGFWSFRGQGFEIGFAVCLVAAAAWPLGAFAVPYVWWLILRALMEKHL